MCTSVHKTVCLSANLHFIWPNVSIILSTSTFKTESKIINVLSSSSLWTCQILNIEYLLLITPGKCSGKSQNKYSKFNTSKLMTDELPRTKDSYPKFGRTFYFSWTRKLFRLCCGLKIISKRNVGLLKEYKKSFSLTFQWNL